MKKLEKELELINQMPGILPLKGSDLG